MDEPTSPAPSDEPPGALPEVAPDDLTPAASAPPEAQPAMAGQRLGGADYLAVVALTGLFGAVCGTHILGLLAGHARFITTQEIETLVPPLSLAAAPVPVALWPTDQWLAQIAQIGHHPLMLAVTALAGAVAALAVVRLMNPGLGSALLARRIERWRVLIAVLASVAVIVAALWPLPDPVMRTQFPTSRAALAGALVWLLWHRQGWLHPTAEPPGLLSIIRQLVSGALLGLVAHTRLRHVLTAADVEILRGWLDGGFQRALVWRELALYAVGVRCLGGLFAGTVACALAPVGVRLRDRVRWLAMPVLVVSVVLFIVGARWQRVWLHQYQWGRPLFRAARIHQPFAEVAAEHCTGLFGGPRGVVIVRPCLERTVLGLRTTDEVAEPRFLPRRVLPGCRIR